MNSKVYTTDTHKEFIMSRLQRLKSNILCQKLIEEKLSEKTTITEDIIKRKSTGLSSSIESALGFIENGQTSLNSKILSRYYFLLQLTIAEQVSSVHNQDSIEEIELHTKKGHGMKCDYDGGQFPDNFYFFITKQGYLSHYLRFLKIDTDEYAIDPNKKQKDKLIQLIELFKRIPELGNIINDYSSEESLAFYLNFYKPKVDNNSNISYARLTTFSNREVDPHLLESLNIDTRLKNVKSVQAKEVGYSGGMNWLMSKMDINITSAWSSFKRYNSKYVSNVYISPLYKNIDDHIVIHLLLLYSLSIIVRYYPSLWHRIEKGDLNQYSSLIEYYILMFDNVVPHSMLQRITGIKYSIRPALNGNGFSQS